MKLLITGGCGFLGSNLSFEALNRGEELVVFDNLSRPGSTDNLAWLRKRGGFRYVHGDIRNSDDVDRLIAESKPDAIFHLAGQVAMTTSIANPRLDLETNLLGTVNLLESVRRNAPEATVVYSSTNKVYGDLEQYRYGETDTRYECVDWPNGFDETIPLDFHSPYGCSKGAADQYMLDYARIFGLRTVVFRHSSMYGGRQFATYDQGWVGWFCQQAAESAKYPGREPFTISGTGKQVRDVLHSDDVTSLYFAVPGKISAAAGKAFNIGGGMENSLSLLELLAMLERFVGTPLRYKNIVTRQSDQRVFVANLGKVNRTFHWRPLVGAEAGVRRIIG